jgi:hypothetical protein
MMTVTQKPYAAGAGVYERSEGKATATLVLGIIGLFILTPILGIVGLFLARNAAPGGQRTAGIILGWIQIGLFVLVALFIGVAVAAGGS